MAAEEEQAVTSEIPVNYKVIALLIAIAIVAALTAFSNVGTTFEVSVLS